MVALPAARVRGRAFHALGDYGRCCLGVPARFARPGKELCRPTPKGFRVYPSLRRVLPVVRSRHKVASWYGFISA